MQLWPRGPSPRLIGVVHLLPLPGAPNPGPPLAEVVERARHDARVLQDGGADGVIVENLGDAPFAPDEVDPATIAAMTRAILAVRDAAPDLVVGVNVLRNAASAALGIAAATDAHFIRVNVHTGAMVTDQGLLQGRARETLLERRRLGTQTVIAADILVKHASPLGELSLEQAARDTYHRGGAGALIVTGAGTGLPANPDDLVRVRRVVPQAPLWVGSGTTEASAPELAPLIDAAIVGTWLHRKGDLTAPLDVDRVRAIAAALRQPRPARD